MAEPPMPQTTSPPRRSLRRDVGRLRAPERVGELERLRQDVVEHARRCRRPRSPRATASRRSSGRGPRGHGLPGSHAAARLHLGARVEPRARAHGRPFADRGARRRPSPAAPPGRPRPRAPAPPRTLSSTAASAPTITRSCSTARSTRASVPTEQLRPSTVCGPTWAPATSEPSSTSEPVSSRRGRLDGTRPASRSQVASR